MSSTSNIEWTDATWNPVRGCDPVSPGCANCYAAGVAARFSGEGQPYEGLAVRKPGQPAKWTGKIALVADKLADPLGWQKPRRVFVNSMSDLFHKDVPDGFIDRVFAVMALAEHHTFQVLTKRADRLAAYFGTDRREEWASVAAFDWGAANPDGIYDQVLTSPWPLPNVWLGTSVENQQAADERIPQLLRTPVAVRFLSCEPLLSAVNLGDNLLPRLSDMKGMLRPDWQPRSVGIDWVIVGGESGPGARPCDVAWVRGIVRQCKAAGVACFTKQLGSFVVDRNDAGFEAENETWADGPDKGRPTNPRAWPTPVDVEHDLDGTRDGYQGAPVRVHLADRKGGTMEEWPWDLRVREFPEVPCPRS